MRATTRQYRETVQDRIGAERGPGWIMYGILRMRLTPTCGAMASPLSVRSTTEDSGEAATITSRARNVRAFYMWAARA